MGRNGAKPRDSALCLHKQRWHLGEQLLDHLKYAFKYVSGHNCTLHTAESGCTGISAGILFTQHLPKAGRSVQQDPGNKKAFCRISVAGKRTTNAITARSLSNRFGAASSMLTAILQHLIPVRAVAILEVLAMSN